MNRNVGIRLTDGTPLGFDFSTIFQNRNEEETVLVDGLDPEQAKWWPRQMCSMNEEMSKLGVEDWLTNKLCELVPSVRKKRFKLKCYWVGIRSVNPKAAPENLGLTFANDIQVEHSDFWRGKIVFRGIADDVPLILLAPVDKCGCYLYIRPFSHVANILKEGWRYVERDMLKVHIPYGQMLLARGDIFHMGSEYEEQNLRIHAYIHYPNSRMDTGLPIDESFVRQWEVSDSTAISPYGGAKGCMYEP